MGRREDSGNLESGLKGLGAQFVVMDTTGLYVAPHDPFQFGKEAHKLWKRS